ncbi:MAG: carbamoyltransferase [Planctomycetes bacterium]|nr:carbamoyltransferase [Planctomycetota bacterium]
MSAQLVLGLNQYTHSASACLLDAQGEMVGALEKERVTRRKHDGGDTAVVVETLLAQHGVDIEDIELVVANNHLFRIRPFEERLPFGCALHQHPPSALRETNLFPGIAKHELSHHLAHAWSVLPLAPFDEGLIVVADGIGTTRADLEKVSEGSELGPYTSDIDLDKAANFAQFPAHLPAHTTARESETVYRFEGLRLERVQKRWAKERTPSFLYNYGFEDMESLGAVYSRVSSHLFGDWNACGKVMGLAPWQRHWGATAQGDVPREAILRGPLESLTVDWPALTQASQPNSWDQIHANDAALRSHYTELAARVQQDLETVLLEWLIRLRKQTKSRNLCLAGGVALNSTANGRIAREAGFDQVFIPPWPGDDGVSIGCALFGHHALRSEAQPRRTCFSPYQGGAANNNAIEEAFDLYGPWLTIETVDSAGMTPAPEAQSTDWLAAAQGRVQTAIDALTQGKTVGWFQGRSEFGPRALGNRSILATPTEAGMIDRINSAIKKREGFRPFAPTVLSEAADEWFPEITPSPAMSLTVGADPDHAAHIPAVVHVDGSARIQTLDEEVNPLYRLLIEGFSEHTGIPMVLNTSFNVKGEPIVETPSDALRHYLDSELDLVVLEGWSVRRRAFPEGEALAAAVPQHLPSFTAEVVSNAEGDAVRVSLLAHGDNMEASQLELGILEACAGKASVAALETEFAAEFEVPVEEFRASLARLYRWRLIWFG